MSWPEAFATLARCLVMPLTIAAGLWGFAQVVKAIDDDD
jgi:hypothetical protein